MRLTRPSFSKSLFYAIAVVFVAIGGLWIAGGMATFTWVEVSEMIPFNKVVDTQAGQDLHTNVYFIRQNFQIQAASLSATAEMIGFVLALLGLGVALFSFLPVWQTILGAALWLGIVAFTLSDASFPALSQIISGQIFSLSLVALAGLSVLSAAAIPSFLLGLSHGSHVSSSKKNRTILGLVWGINLLLTFSKSKEVNRKCY